MATRIIELTYTIDIEYLVKKRGMAINLDNDFSAYNDVRHFANIPPFSFSVSVIPAALEVMP